jgi:formate hydrogenlyase subunit 3/multisubunit Na+/H+ antiporter MnhD subunit
MPWVAWLVLVGVLAGSGLPPMVGFISEWLLLQSFLFTTVLPNSFSICSSRWWPRRWHSSWRWPATRW